MSEIVPVLQYAHVDTELVRVELSIELQCQELDRMLGLCDEYGFFGRKARVTRAAANAAVNSDQLSTGITKTGEVRNEIVTWASY